MTYPMPPELLEQLGLEPCADTDPQWPEDHDALMGQRSSSGNTDEDERQRSTNRDEVGHGR